MSPLSNSPTHSHLSSQTLSNAVRSHSPTDRDFVYRIRITGNAIEETLRRISAIPKNTSVLKIFFPESTEKSVALSDIRRAHFSLCLKIHPDKGGSDNIELATRCTQTISKCFELCKGYAESDACGSSCFIPETVTFTGFENSDDHHCETEEYSSPEGFGDDIDNIFESFFPGDEGGYMKANDNRESDGHRTSYAYDSVDLSEKSSDDSVVFVSETKQQDLTGADQISTPLKNIAKTKTTSFQDRSSPQIETLNRARASKRFDKERIREEARQALAEERRASESWHPQRAVELIPETGLEMDARWKCERYCRAHTAFLSIQRGVNIHQTAETVSLTCRERHCKAKLWVLRNPGTGLWRLREFKGHLSACSGKVVSRDENSGGNCVPAYTAKQVARMILPELRGNPSLTTKFIVLIVNAKQIYSRQPGLRHFCAIKTELSRMMAANRLEEMASMEGYALLLRELSHYVEILTCSADEMREIRVKAARFIFCQLKKGGLLPEEEKFDHRIVQCADIVDGRRYYSGFVFVPNIASHFCRYGRATTAADAAHCQECGPQSYGTTYEVVVYDAKYNLVSLLFALTVATESEESWTIVFRNLKNVSGFDVKGRVTIVDQERSIDCSFEKTMENAKLCLDPLRVKKNMAKDLGRKNYRSRSIRESRACTLT